MIARKKLQKYKGKKINQSQFDELHELAKYDFPLHKHLTTVANKIKAAKKENPSTIVDIEITEALIKKFAPATFESFIEGLGAPQNEEFYLNGIEEIQEESDTLEGLGKAVTPDQIYQMITDKMIALIEKASGSGYKKTWNQDHKRGYMIPFNFVSGKPYRGINFGMLTTFGTMVLENPFFLTFKQVAKLKGKVKKGAEGKPVVYFTILYTYQQDDPKIDFGTYDKKKFLNWANKNKSTIKAMQGPGGLDAEELLQQSTRPILKYYNVFNGNDIEGIDFDLENFKIGFVPGNQELENNDDRVKLADLIVANYPKPSPSLTHKGERAFYQHDITGNIDNIVMPAYIDFKTGLDYYRTLFHEYSHSTGNPKRLARKMTGAFGSTDYAKEELVAEFGAVFLSAHAGILWRNNNNHAEYIKNWKRNLKHIKDDNRLIMRASSLAQASTDFILNYDENGIPAYQLDLKKEESTPAKKKPTPKKEIEKTATAIAEGNIVMEWNEYWDDEDTIYTDIEAIDKKLKTIPEEDLPNDDTYIKVKLKFKGHTPFRLYVSRNKGDFNPLKQSLFDYLETNYKNERIDFTKFSSNNKEVKAKPTANNLPDFSDPKTYENDLDYETLKRSRYWTSFSPDKYSKYEIEDWKNYLVDNYNQKLSKAVEQNITVDDFNQSYLKFWQYLLKAKQKVVAARSKTISSAVTGPAKFPVAKAKSASNRYHDVLGEFYKAQEKGNSKLLNLIYPTKSIKSGSTEAVRLLKDKVEAGTLLNEKIKYFNKNLQGKKSTSEEKEAYIIENNLQKLIETVTPNAGKPWILGDAIKGQKMVMMYLTKIINDTKKRIKSEEIRAKQIDVLGNGWKIEAGEVVLNSEENRLQIIFEGKPDEETRTLLKKNGFRWSPKFKAWQRQMTRNAISTTKTLFPEAKPVKKQPPVKVDNKGQYALLGAATKKKKRGLKSPQIVPIEKEGNSVSGEMKNLPKSGKKYENISSASTVVVNKNPIFNIAGETGKFLGKIEKKPKHSVVFTLDGEKFSGKTTSLHKFINDFASGGNRCCFATLEEHKDSNLSIEKRNEYFSPENLHLIDLVSHFNSYKEFIEIISNYDCIFIDSLPKLQNLINLTKMDEQLRMAVNGKFIFLICQQTVDGKTRGGATIGFDGDATLKAHTMGSFEENFIDWEKNRYSPIAPGNAKYMIASGKAVFVDNKKPLEIPSDIKSPPMVIKPGDLKFDFECID